MPAKALKRKTPPSQQLLLSKLATPVVPDSLLDRKRLANPLASGQPPRIILLEAPAGYSKTCTAFQWLQGSGANCQWLSLDQEDGELETFWQYLLLAFQRCNPSLDTLQACQAPQTKRDIRKFTIELLNVLASASESPTTPRTVVAIDNFHIANHPALLDSLNFFIDHLPVNTQLLLISRNHIDLSHRSQKLASGELLQLGAQQLAFNEKESRQFLSSQKASNNSKRIKQLRERLDGWPMGLKLASLDKNSNSNDAQQSQLIHHYLIEEVYSRLPEPLLSTVSQSICLNRINPEIFDAIFENKGNERLSLLQHQGLFLQATEQSNHFCYHPVFSEAIQEHLINSDRKAYQKQCLLIAEELQKLSYFSEAIELYSSIGEWRLATSLIISLSASRIRAGDFQYLSQWLSRIPESWAERCPRVLYLKALTSSKLNTVESMQPFKWLDDAEKLLKNAIETDLQNTVKKLAEMSFDSREQAINLLEEVHNLRAELIRSHGKSEDYENISWDTVRRASHSNLVLGCATDLGRGMELFLRGKTQAAESALEDAIRHGQQENYQLVMIIAANYLSSLLLLMGRPQDGLRRMDSVLNWISQKDIQFFAREYQGRGAASPILCEQNQLQHAQQEIAPYLEFASTEYPDSIQRLTIYTYHYQLMRSKGDYAEAEMALANASALVVDELDSWNWCVTPLAAYRAELAQLQGDIVTASQWAEKRAAKLVKSREFRTEEERLILARVWIAEEKFDEALKLLTCIQRSAKQEKRLRHMVRSHVLEALCYQATGEQGLAQSAMSTALTLAEPCQFKRAIIDEGAAVAPLLQQALNGGVCKTYTRTLLEACPRDELDNKASSTGKGVLIEPLSNREAEILLLVGEGLRNKGIAEQLSISISTVKAHIYNIFSKLQVSSRTEAVSKARKLDILTE